MTSSGARWDFWRTFSFATLWSKTTGGWLFSSWDAAKTLILTQKLILREVRGLWNMLPPYLFFVAKQRQPSKVEGFISVCSRGITLETLWIQQTALMRLRLAQAQKNIKKIGFSQAKGQKYSRGKKILDTSCICEALYCIKNQSSVSEYTHPACALFCPALNWMCYLQHIHIITTRI